MKLYTNVCDQNIFFFKTSALLSSLLMNIKLIYGCLVHCSQVIIDEIFVQYYFVGTLMLLGNHLTDKSETRIIIYIRYSKDGTSSSIISGF
jgi:hypothetical protein